MTHAAAPSRAALERLLSEHAPLSPAPLCPELLIHQAHTLVGVWEAAESLAAEPLAAPFWAYAWPAGAALARVILDSPERVAGRRVIDFGAGGGIASLAAARAGAASVTANDIDPWALLVTTIAASSQGIQIHTLDADLCEELHLVGDYDVVICSDLAYERRQAPRQRAVLDRAVTRGALVLVADAGRTYFDETGMRQLAEYEVDVPQDLEGVTRRTAKVYAMALS